MHKHRFFLPLATLLLLLCGFCFQGAAHANASRQMHFSVTCGGDGCDGLDPIATGCVNDAYTARVAYIQDPQGNTIGEVDLRFSPTCGTNWARVISYIGTTTLSPVILRNDGLAYCWPNVPFDGMVGDCFLNHSTTNLRAWTAMVYSPQPNTAFAEGCVSNECRATDLG